MKTISKILLLGFLCFVYFAPNSNAIEVVCWPGQLGAQVPNPNCQRSGLCSAGVTRLVCHTSPDGTTGTFTDAQGHVTPAGANLGIYNPPANLFDNASRLNRQVSYSLITGSGHENDRAVPGNNSSATVAAVRQTIHSAIAPMPPAVASRFGSVVAAAAGGAAGSTSGNRDAGAGDQAGVRAGTDCPNCDAAAVAAGMAAGAGGSTAGLNQVAQHLGQQATANRCEQLGVPASQRANPPQPFTMFSAAELATACHRGVGDSMWNATMGFLIDTGARNLRMLSGAARGLGDFVDVWRREGLVEAGRMVGRSVSSSAGSASHFYSDLREWLNSRGEYLACLNRAAQIQYVCNVVSEAIPLVVSGVQGVAALGRASARLAGRAATGLVSIARSGRGAAVVTSAAGVTETAIVEADVARAMQPRGGSGSGLGSGRSSPHDIIEFPGARSQNVAATRNGNVPAVGSSGARAAAAANLSSEERAAFEALGVTTDTTPEQIQAAVSRRMGSFPTGGTQAQVRAHQAAAAEVGRNRMTVEAALRRIRGGEAVAGETGATASARNAQEAGSRGQSGLLGEGGAGVPEGSSSALDGDPLANLKNRLRPGRNGGGASQSGHSNPVEGIGAPNAGNSAAEMAALREAGLEENVTPEQVMEAIHARQQAGRPLSNEQIQRLSSVAMRNREAGLARLHPEERAAFEALGVSPDQNPEQIRRLIERRDATAPGYARNRTLVEDFLRRAQNGGGGTLGLNPVVNRAPRASDMQMIEYGRNPDVQQVINRQVNELADGMGARGRMKPISHTPELPPEVGPRLQPALKGRQALAAQLEREAAFDLAAEEEAAAQAAAREEAARQAALNSGPEIRLPPGQEPPPAPGARLAAARSAEATGEAAGSAQTGSRRLTPAQKLAQMNGGEPVAAPAPEAAPEGGGRSSEARSTLAENPNAPAPGGAPEVAVEAEARPSGPRSAPAPENLSQLSPAERQLLTEARGHALSPQQMAQLSPQARQVLAARRALATNPNRLSPRARPQVMPSAAPAPVPALNAATEQAFLNAAVEGHPDRAQEMQNVVSANPRIRQLLAQLAAQAPNSAEGLRLVRAAGARVRDRCLNRGVGASGAGSSGAQPNSSP